jgi:hypothetical protein
MEWLVKCVDQRNSRNFTRSWRSEEVAFEQAALIMRRDAERRQLG